MCVVGVTSEPLTSPAAGYPDIRTVFLLLSPAGNAQIHLDSLGALAKLLSEEGFAKELADAINPDRALEAIMGHA